ncbi:MAG: DUF1345 domain-containing protein [Alphaproteobacteria bacterium]
MADPEKDRNSTPKKAAAETAGAAKPRPIWLVRHVKARPRLLTAVGAMIAAYILLPPELSVQTRLLGGFDTGIAIYLGLVFDLTMRANPERVRRRARLEDEGRWAVLILAVAAAGACLVAIGTELHAARQAAKDNLDLRLAFAGGTILLAWLFVHTSFAIHYAHEFYRDIKSDRPEKSGGNETRGALIFPEEDCPDYWDFLYFSFVLGATCQVSDVQVTSRVLRRLVLAHGVLAFIFNTLILALAINIAASAF